MWFKLWVSKCVGNTVLKYLYYTIQKPSSTCLPESPMCLKNKCNKNVIKIQEDRILGVNEYKNVKIECPIITKSE